MVEIRFRRSSRSRWLFNQTARSSGCSTGAWSRVCQPSTRRMVICPEAIKAQNSMVAVSALGKAHWVFTSAWILSHSCAKLPHMGSQKWNGVSLLYLPLTWWVIPAMGRSDAHRGDCARHSVRLAKWRGATRTVRNIIQVCLDDFARSERVFSGTGNASRASSEGARPHSS